MRFARSRKFRYNRNALIIHPVRGPEIGAVMKAVWKFFASVRLAIVLLILVAVASVIGTLLPRPIYHTVWFLALLFLFGINTVVCTLSRLPAKWRRTFDPALAEDPSGLLAMRAKARFARNVESEKLRTAIAERLAALHYRTAFRTDGGVVHVLGRKRKLGVFGSDVVHLGLIIILVGGIVSGLLRIHGSLALSQGQTEAVPRAAFEVRLDKFETEYYPQGSVKAWKSTVSVVENGRDVLTRTVAVNKPLSYKSYMFYQTSYGFDWSRPTLEIAVKKTGDPSFSRTLTVTPGVRVPVDDKDVTAVAVTRFIPDFVIGEGNVIQSRSEEPNNPAALVEGWKDGEKVFAGWVFARYPDFNQMHSGKPTDLVFVLKTFKGTEYSVLQVARDPGLPLIWIGCVLVCAGIFLAFYWPPREIAFILEPGRDKTEVTAGGRAAKNRDAFQSEFDSLIDDLRRS